MIGYLFNFKTGRQQIFKLKLSTCLQERHGIKIIIVSVKVSKFTIHLYFLGQILPSINLMESQINNINENAALEIMKIA